MTRLCTGWLRLEQGAYGRVRAATDRTLARRAERQGLRPKPNHLLIGERGEDQAFFHLRERGYTVVARRWTSPRARGDLDLVAWDGATLVVVEVKTRSAHDLAPAETAVDRDKQTQLRKLARLWLRQLPARFRHRVGVRFDILSVYLLADGPEFQHFQNAFALRPPPHQRGRGRW